MSQEYTLEQIDAEISRREQIAAIDAEIAKRESAAAPKPDNRTGMQKANDYLGYLNDSIGKGVRHAVSAPAQFINPFIDYAAGTNLTGDLNKMNQERDAQYASKYPEGGIVGDTLSNVAEGLPSMLTGAGALKTAAAGTKGLAWLGNMAKGGASAGIASAPLVYDESGNATPLEKTVTGGLVGGMLAPTVGAGAKAVGAGYGALKKSITPQKSAVDALMGDISNPAKTLARKEAGDRLGLNLSPAEASRSPMAARAQADLGYTREGAQTLERQEILRMQQEKQMLDSLMKDISPSGEVASADVRSAAKTAIKDKEKDLSATSKQLYDEALYLNPGESKAILDPNNPVVSGKMLRNVTPGAMETVRQDKLIADALSNVKKDKVFKKDLDGVPEHTVKYLDYTKKYLDDKIGVAMRKGQKNKVRLLQDSKEKLVDAIDAEIPQYKEARMTFGPGAQAIQKLRETGVGKIAKMKDDKIKNIASVIFDRKQTDPTVMAELRDEISAKDPNAWRRILRNEMENRMVSADMNEGTAFYNKVLKNDNDFNNFMEAAKGLPNVQQKLKDMREVLPGIFNAKTVKAAKGNQENHMSSWRNTHDAVINAVKRTLAQDYDKAAIKLITSGKWDKEFSKLMKIKNPNSRETRVKGLLESIIGASIPEVSKGANSFLAS